MVYFNYYGYCDDENTYHTWIDNSLLIFIVLLFICIFIWWVTPSVIIILI